ncbi:MAG TPA: hypothetical protein VLN72_00555 [Gillisia sp.]|nr:hypothetical protein [Gillisia sp.]
MKNAVLIFSFLLLSFCSCNKEDVVPAPPITAENTFSCKIDGELFVPKQNGGFIRFPGIIVITNDNNWHLILNNGEKELHIYLANLNRVGNYIISDSDGNKDFFNETRNAVELDDTSELYYISKQDSGLIEVIELEQGKRLIFQFDKLKLYNSNNPGKSIMLEDGKLNINLENLNE